MNPKLTGSRYVLAVNDLAVSAEFYISQLGFKTRWEGHGWHSLYRDNISIMIGECAGEKPASETGDHSYFGYFEIEHIDALYQEYKSKGVKILSSLEDKPWGQREFAIRTIDGHRITFGEEVSHNAFTNFMAGKK